MGHVNVLYIAEVNNSIAEVEMGKVMISLDCKKRKWIIAGMRSLRD